MKQFNKAYFPIFLSVCLVVTGCSLNRTKKGAMVGTATGAAMGAVIGKASGNTAVGAIIGAAVGGTAGAVIGHQMDKQAEDIKKAVPDAEVIRVAEGIVVEFNNNILFAFGKSDLSNDAKENLGKLVTILDSYKDTNIEVQGHTDSRGSEAFNQTLSEQRALVVSNYLISKGIQRNRLNIVGFGELLPKYLNTTTEGRDKNRRVEFLITANDKMKADAINQAGK